MRISTNTRLRFCVSYTYLTEGGNRQYAMDVVEMPRLIDVVTMEEHAILYVCNEVSSEGVVLGCWSAQTLEPTVYAPGNFDPARWPEPLAGGHIT